MYHDQVARTGFACGAWLYKQMGMSYENFNRMINNLTKSIQYEKIETLCAIFAITPNELFEYDFEEKPREQ